MFSQDYLCFSSLFSPRRFVLHSAHSGIFLVLRSLASFPAPHVSPTCAFGCRSRGDVLGCFEQGFGADGAVRIPSSLNDCTLTLPREADANSESSQRPAMGQRLSPPALKMRCGALEAATQPQKGSFCLRQVKPGGQACQMWPVPDVVQRGGQGLKDSLLGVSFPGVS